ncbi:MAG: hypothetical protein J6X03_00615 [Bacilli bacterium]|nr:hypothetical protein [Bacilli bacterium]
MRLPKQLQGIGVGWATGEHPSRLLDLSRGAIDVNSEFTGCIDTMQSFHFKGGIYLWETQEFLEPFVYLLV